MSRHEDYAIAAVQKLAKEAEFRSIPLPGATRAICCCVHPKCKLTIRAEVLDWHWKTVHPEGLDEPKEVVRETW